MSKSFEKSIKQIVDVANYLDENRQFEMSSQLDKIAANLVQIKTAQYVGIQGYWMRNTRCWKNCYRQKRSSEKGKTAQEIWTECHREYLGSINNPTSGWEKYAQDDNKITKFAEEKIKKIIGAEKSKFDNELRQKIEDGFEPSVAANSVINDNILKYSSLIINEVKNLIKISERLKEHGAKNISLRVSKITNDIIKDVIDS